VKNMSGMFAGNTNLSINNYDSLLIGWYARIFPENPLRPSVSFSAGNAKYCKGNLPRSFIISTYGWTITDGGMDCSTSVEELESSKVKIYPNPASNSITISAQAGKIEVYDILGKKLISCNKGSNNIIINTESFDNGVYFVRFISDINETKIIKFIINK
jgi:hypothetical protein